jgi:putative oxidoreductase
MNSTSHEKLVSVGLLVLRLGAGGLLVYGHGWGKLVHFSERAGMFADPLHVGPPASLALTVFAEVFCAIAVALGAATRVAALVLVGLFGTLVFVHHGNDPFKQRELAMIYGVPFLALLITGPGAYSVDAWLARALGRRKI